jgi:hypothetical protein
VRGNKELAVFPPAPGWGPDEGGIGRHPNPQTDLRLSGREICLSLQHVAHSAIKRRRTSHFDNLDAALMASR